MLRIYGGQSALHIAMKNGKTPLVNLCSTGDFKLAKMLLDNGANINKVDESRKTALHNAFARGNKEGL